MGKRCEIGLNKSPFSPIGPECAQFGMSKAEFKRTVLLSQVQNTVREVYAGVVNAC